MFIPALPGDTGVFSGSTDVESDVIKSRTVQLGLFLQQISNIPFLVTCTILRSFLSATEDFKATLATAEQNTDGEVTWKLLVDSVSLPIDPERLVTDIKRQTNVLGVALKQVEDGNILQVTLI